MWLPSSRLDQLTPVRQKTTLDQMITWPLSRQDTQLTQARQRMTSDTICRQNLQVGKKIFKICIYKDFKELIYFTYLVIYYYKSFLYRNWRWYQTALQTTSRVIRDRGWHWSSYQGSTRRHGSHCCGRLICHWNRWCPSSNWNSWIWLWFWFWQWQQAIRYLFIDK